MAGRTFLAGTIIVVLAAIVTGLVMTGGPFQARRDRFDEARLSDLNSLALALHCRRQTNPDAVLPTELSFESLEAYCGRSTALRSAFVDDETGDPYRYVRVSDREFSLCATFHDARRVTGSTEYRSDENSWPGSFEFDPGSGCLSGAMWTEE